jgi:hypothetical protein
MVDYGIIIPSIIYEKLSDFVKKQSKPVQLLIGWTVGIPLFFMDVFLTFATPFIMFLMFLVSLRFLSQKIAFFLYEVIMVLLNRYVTKRREIILTIWQCFFMMLNIFLVFMLNNGKISLIGALFFVLASLASGIVNINIIGLRAQKKDYQKFEIVQKITDVLLLISTICLAI